MMPSFGQRASTAKNGAGEKNGSNCTPRGRHIIRARIGAGCAPNTVFVGRRPTGELWTPELQANHPRRDWILTRILWLSGCEPGRNRLHDVDTMRRYIYIHGTNHEDRLGTPVSGGCVLMNNLEIAALYEEVRAGDQVWIGE